MPAFHSLLRQRPALWSLLLVAWLIPPRTTSAADALRYPPDLTLSEVEALFSKPPLPHPRLLANAEDLRRLRERVARDPQSRAVAEAVRREADALLGVPPIERKLEGRRLLGESRRAVRRSLTLAMAYHLTTNTAYADRAAREMQAVAAFPDWNPSHFLDVAEMTFALAIGYDWLHGQLDAETRATVRAAILAKGVRVPLETEHHRWTQAANNWGQVCHAGMVAGALAVLEDDPATAARTIQRALANVPRSMAAFAPKGSYPEGPSYWAYGTTYNVLLIAMLESALGSAFGLDHAPGFDQTGAYLALATGPSGLTFNYADGGSGRGVEPAVHWFANRFHRPEWLIGEERARQQALASRPDATSGSERFFPLLLLWGQDGARADVSRLPLHWTSGSKVPVAFHRSAWTGSNTVWVGLKGGSPSSPHGHMDIGSFVLDADGVRWATDLGAEGYHRIESRGMNLWNRAQNSERWTIFRQGSLSHNTLVIDGELQKAAGHGDIARFSDSAAFPHSVVDLSAVYAGQAREVQRGVALLPEGTVLVRDRLTGLKPGASVRWGMVTLGKPESFGTRTLVLRQGGASLNLRIVHPAEATWSLIDTAEPRNEWDSPNPGTVMTAFTARAPDSGTLELTVLLTPGNRPVPELGSLHLRPPLEWSPARAGNP